MELEARQSHSVQGMKKRLSVTKFLVDPSVLVAKNRYTNQSFQPKNLHNRFFQAPSCGAFAVGWHFVSDLARLRTPSFYMRRH